MKLKRYSLIFITIITLMALYTVNAFALQFSFYVGNVKVLRDGKKITPVLNKTVLSGDHIITGKGGMAVLKYKDGSEINIQEKTNIKIGSKMLKGKKEESISVIAGVIKGKFGKLMKGSTRKVYTPTTVCAIRGTEFTLGVSKGADSRVNLKEGNLQVRNPYGKKNLEPGQKADIGVAEKPKEGSDVSMKQWKSGKDTELKENPKGKGEKIKSQIKKFNERSSSASKDVDNADKKIRQSPIKKKKDLKEAGSEIDSIEEKVEDDMMLNEATSSSIDGILNKFKSDKKEMYDIFLRIKKESNKVLEQQRKNYEAIQEVREAYKKAYNEIMGKHKKYMNNVKPKFKRKMKK